MKFLDILIVVLIVLVLGSGGFLIYLVYDNYSGDQNNSNVNKSDNSVITEIPQVDNCVDNDGDGYGIDCEKGLDCDDDDRTRNTDCRILEGGMVELIDKNPGKTYSVGDVIEIEVKINGVSSIQEKLDAFQLSTKFDAQIVKFVEFAANKDYQAIPVNEDKDGLGEVEVHMIDSGEDLIQEGEIAGILKFEAVSAGAVKVEVTNKTRIGVIYEIPGGSIDISVV